MILSWRELSSSQDSRIRVFGSLYINKMFCSLQEDFFLGKKKFFLREEGSKKKEFFAEKTKKATAHLFQRERKGVFFFQTQIHPYKPKTKAKILFLLYSSFKTTFKSNKRLQSHFSSQKYNQNDEHPLKEKSILHQHLFSTPFFIIFNYFV